jgi:hypothetical protein
MMALRSKLGAVVFVAASPICVDSLLRIGRTTDPMMLAMTLTPEGWRP